MKTDNEFLDSYAVINRISNGITVSDIRGHFEIFNIRMQEITGYTMNEANRDGNFNALIHPGPTDRQGILKGLSEIYEEKESRES